MLAQHTQRPLVFTGLAISLLVGCGDDSKTAAQAPPDTDLTTIAEARAKKLGELAKVEGYVSVAPAVFYSATGDLGFAIQDETAGIYINVYDTIPAPLGSKVRALGVLLDVAGQKVLASGADSIEVLPDPKQDVLPKDIQTGSLGESTEGLLVRVKGPITKAPVDDKANGQYYGVTTAVNDGSGEAKIYVPIYGKTQMPLINTATLTVGTTVEITGFAQQYNTTYEIDPRLSSDMVLP